ncbi:MAG: zinc ribbon domain-containing protein [Candidatus Acidiferrum sp.]
MAGFCGKCGSPLDDAQAFCARCGTSVSGAPARPSAQTSAPALLQAARPPAASTVAPAKSSNTLLKVLIAFVIVIFLLGALGIAGVWYVGHRIKQKVHDMGLDEVSSTSNDHRGPALSVNPCSLLAKADVAQAAKMDVVRAETAEDSVTTCKYSVIGNNVDLVSKHISLLHKDETTDSQRQMMETLAKSIGHGNDADQSAPRHPGESPILIFTVDNNSAVAQMNLSRATLGRIGPGLTTIPSLGDDAFDIGNALIMVRKGDRVIRIVYMMCPCTTDDVIPLARKIVASM